MNILKEIIKNGEIDAYADEERNEKLRQDIMSINPSKLITDDIMIDYWTVEYAYTTVRGRKRENIKNLFVNKSKDKADIKLQVLDEISKFNKQNPHRSLSNVKILDVKCVGTIKLNI